MSWVSWINAEKPPMPPACSTRRRGARRTLSVSRSRTCSMVRSTAAVASRIDSRWVYKNSVKATR